MLQIKLRSIADQEIAEAITWYASRSPEVARRLFQAIDDTLERIRLTPEVFPRVSVTLRRATVTGFPYRLYYRVFPQVISVVGCIHARRDPALILRRE